LGGLVERLPEEVADQFHRWIAYRTEAGRPLTSTATQAALEQATSHLTEFGPEKLTKAMRDAMAAGSPGWDHKLQRIGEDTDAERKEANRRIRAERLAKTAKERKQIAEGRAAWQNGKPR
jgi:hypothetical protein